MVRLAVLTQWTIVIGYR